MRLWGGGSGRGQRRHGTRIERSDQETQLATEYFEHVVLNWT
ncbi:hypothetical protein RKLH11_3888 [Rhodobacteraceae bacterium KLH11]|nr:hypothetical protein RKLH11_3888 [Rhodobacteraceae bacterium KLH11]